LQWATNPLWLREDQVAEEEAEANKSTERQTNAAMGGSGKQCDLLGMCRVGHTARGLPEGPVHVQDAVPGDEAPTEVLLNQVHRSRVVVIDVELVLAQFLRGRDHMREQRPGNAEPTILRADVEAPEPAANAVLLIVPLAGQKKLSDDLAARDGD